MSTALDFASLLRSERMKAEAAKAQKSLATLPATSSAPTSPWSSLSTEIASFQLLDERAPGAIYYCARWLNVEQQRNLIALIDADTTQALTQRRLKMFGGVPVAASSGGMVAEAMPVWLRSLLDALERCDILQARGHGLNHVLLNEYAHGRGIARHQDGPLYDDLALVLSLCSGALMRFTERRSGREVHVYLEPGSLLAFQAEAYSVWHHEIATSAVDELDARCLAGAPEDSALPVTLARAERRLSLTVRRVLAIAERPALLTHEQVAERQRRAQGFYKNVSEALQAGDDGADS